MDLRQIGIALAVAAIGAAVATPFVSRLARFLGIVDQPNERKVSQRDNMPLLGGLAVAAGTALGLGSMLAMSGDSALVGVEFKGFLIGSLLLLALGIIDDRSGIGARPKLAVQIIAALIAVTFGFRIEEFREPLGGNEYILPIWLQWGVTTLWIVAVTNAMNLVDGLDGEAAGLGCIIAITLSLICWQVDQRAGVILGVALVGALLGFLPFNFPPAKIFLGDTGALFIGYALSLLSIQGYIGGHRKAALLTFAVPMLALAVPLLDTGSSILRRLRSGRPILDADNLHLHHRLLASEGSHRSAVLSLYFLTACFCIIALSFSRLRGFVAVAFFGAVVILTVRLLWNMGALRGELHPRDRRADSARRQIDRGEPGEPGERTPDVNDGRALITGVTGQDGSYLAELLLEKGYEVHGVVRRASTETFERIAHIRDRITLHQADLLDQGSLINTLRQVRPAEIYNLAAQSFVPTSWVQPTLTGEFTALGVTRMLEAVRLVDETIRFYQASSSEMFGRVVEVPQNEATPFYPRSPYAVAKLYGHWITVNYRESYGLHAVSGVLFNHESPRRGREFVTRKITETAAKLKLGLVDELKLGSADSMRDWGYALEYVDAMWRMLQRDEPHDYVIGTGVQHSVRECYELAFAHVGLDPADFVSTDPELLRPAEVDTLLADPTKAREELGWRARTSFAELVAIMVEADLEAQEAVSGRRRGGPGTR